MSQGAQTTATYDPGVFDVVSLEQAKGVIVTPEGRSTANRWAHETDWLAQEAIGRLGLGRGSLVLDYGCGAGRIAKRLIERAGCEVLGVDISQSMRMLASAYVDDERFLAIAPDDLRRLDRPVDAAICVWVLQHCFEPVVDITRIKRALKPGGRAMVVNNRDRVVPVDGGRWIDDGLDVQALLDSRLARAGELEGLAPAVASAELRAASYLGVWGA